MTFPKLPTCAPWCTSQHTAAGENCRRVIDDISGPAARDDIEVNVVRDGGRDLVQVLVEDKDLQARERGLGRYEVRLSAADSGVLGDTIRHLDHRGAIMVGNALFAAMTLLRERGCPFAWCTVDHAPLSSEPDHHRSESVEVGGVSLTRHLVVNSTTVPDTVFVRVRYRRGGLEVYEDISPREAADRADFLQALEVGAIDALTAAFRQAAADLGVTE
jgi:hypothetical protein